MKHITLAAMALALVTLPSLASAQTPSAAPSATITRGANGHRVYASDEIIHVHASPQRPYAFEIPGRGPLGYRAVEDRRGFVREVLLPLRREPF